MLCEEHAPVLESFAERRLDRRHVKRCHLLGPIQGRESLREHARAAFRGLEFHHEGVDRAARFAPENLFHETDLYTIHRAGGERDLVLEDGLAGLESRFVAIRDNTLLQRRELTLEDRLVLCAFMAATRARTPAQRDHLGGFWSKVRQTMDDMSEWAKTATPEQRRAAASLARGSGPSLGYDDVRHMAEKPMQTMLIPQIDAASPLLVVLDLAVIGAEPVAMRMMPAVRSRDPVSASTPTVWASTKAARP